MFFFYLRALLYQRRLEQKYPLAPPPPKSRTDSLWYLFAYLYFTTNNTKPDGSFR